MRLSEKLVNILLVLLVAVLAIICIRSVCATQKAVDMEKQKTMTDGRY